MGRLANKVALITGAATGIGLATTRRFVEEGAYVLMTDKNTEVGEAAVKEFGENARFIAQDVTKEEDWQQVMATITSDTKGLDILVNNAGILSIGDHQTIEDTDLAHWQAIQKVNVEGVFLGCQSAIKAMKDRGGAIVNISSVAAIIGTPTLAAYGASKAAVRQLTKTVAIHCANKEYGIRCNSVHPDPVRTNMGDELMEMYGGNIEKGWDAIPGRVPLKAAAEPVDIANCILFLASDEARHVTGSELVVDGGMTAI
ncbi:glucose 1-dehydrogenase [Sneathiella sp. HT1-7]|uniref:glucose 1-dehydrogenase n=1 Tax=Sneathiella sp. HT1-7 TaxID=2887192 RepID=UPI001D133823|nr:glucose 1-dehydrogenase [Sneathiella sp. HT1-7]MCC3303766.1 glucose 1-dehydrogenase [Sneathiella sp. HT1-7]